MEESEVEAFFDRRLTAPIGDEFNSRAFRESNEEVCERLAANGDLANIARPVTHFLMDFRRRVSAGAAIVEVREYFDAPAILLTEGCLFHVVFGPTQQTTINGIMPFCEVAAIVAKAFGGTYDYWESPVIKSPEEANQIDPFDSPRVRALLGKDESPLAD